MSTYCDFVADKGRGTVHEHYHNHEYGFPLDDDNALFERLVLEINQAGLSWELILKRKPMFERAFDQFDIDKVAAYTDEDRARLLADPGVIRNRLKVNAAIENARRIVALRATHGSFKNWLDAQADHRHTKADWVKLFKKTFVFTGGEIVNEFLMSTGYLPGAHAEHCPVYAEITALNPSWLRKPSHPASAT